MAENEKDSSIEQYFSFISGKTENVCSFPCARNGMTQENSNFFRTIQQLDYELEYKTARCSEIARRRIICLWQP